MFYELVLQLGWTLAHWASASGHADCLEVLGRLAPESLSVPNEVYMLFFVSLVGVSA